MEGKIILKKIQISEPDLKTIWHPESTLVFKSMKEKKVIGRYVDDTYIEMDELTLELCEKWKFKYDQELYDQLFGEEDESENTQHSESETVEEQNQDAVEQPKSVEQPNEETSQLRLSEFEEGIVKSIRTVLQTSADKYENSIKTLTVELNSVKEAHAVLKNKFDMMKQLFT